MACEDSLNEFHENTDSNKRQKRDNRSLWQHRKKTTTSNDAKDALDFSVEMKESDKYCTYETSTSEVSLAGHDYPNIEWK